MNSLKHHILLTYHIKKLSQKDKVKFLRLLNGYKEQKKKLYKHEGILQELNIKRVGTNTLLTDITNYPKLQSFFQENNIKTETIEIWIK